MPFSNNLGILVTATALEDHYYFLFFFDYDWKEKGKCGKATRCSDNKRKNLVQLFGMSKEGAKFSCHQS